MSYILDALRRAEAERGRGGVPGLHTQTTPAPGALPANDGSARSRWLAVAVAGVGMAALAAGGTWWALQRSAPTGGVVLAGAQPSENGTVGGGPAAAPAVAAAAVSSQASPSPGGAPQAPVPPAPAPVPAAAPAPVAAAPTSPAPRATPQPVREKPAVPAGRAAAPEPARPRTAEAPAERAPAPPAPSAARPQEPAPAAAPSTPTGTVFAQSDLPDAVRAQLPVLKISGASYSTNATYRMAIVNGQVLHEGDLAAPGLMLEKIEPGRTIWSFKGYRYGLASQ